MEAKPGIDRRKHEVDVLEQVLKGVHAEPAEPDSAPHVVGLSLRRWLGGSVASAVQVQIIEDDDSDQE
jgi:hypothetical protein